MSQQYLPLEEDASGVDSTESVINRIVDKTLEVIDEQSKLNKQRGLIHVASIRSALLPPDRQVENILQAQLVVKKAQKHPSLDDIELPILIQNVYLKGNHWIYMDWKRNAKPLPNSTLQHLIETQSKQKKKDIESQFNFPSASKSSNSKSCQIM